MSCRPDRFVLASACAIFASEHRKRRCVAHCFPDASPARFLVACNWHLLCNSAAALNGFCPREFEFKETRVVTEALFVAVAKRLCEVTGCGSKSDQSTLESVGRTRENCGEHRSSSGNDHRTKMSDEKCCPLRTVSQACHWSTEPGGRRADAARTHGAAACFRTTPHFSDTVQALPGPLRGILPSTVEPEFLTSSMSF